MKIGIIVALDREYEQLSQVVAGDNIHIMRAGIGKVNAAISTIELIRRYSPDCIINTGVAGGLDNCLDIMDVVTADRICYHDVWCGYGNAAGQVQGLPVYFNCDKDLVDSAREFSNHVGLLCSGDQFIDSREKGREIKEKFPEALAVDMESAAIAQVCLLDNIPFMAMRVISDAPESGTNASQYKNFWKTVSDSSFKAVRGLIEKIR